MNISTLSHWQRLKHDGQKEAVCDLLEDMNDCMIGLRHRDDYMSMA